MSRVPKRGTNHHHARPPELDIDEQTAAAVLGAVASPDDPLAALIDQWEPLLEPDARPLEAELCGAEFLAVTRQGTPGPDHLPDLLVVLVGEAEQHGGPAALAMLRVLAVTAPDPAVRAAAGPAADRLAATGVPDCGWVAQLGAPKPSGCFGYSDGAQQVIVICFRYLRKRHAVAVLIDHQFGGGVKDVWVTDQPDRIRSAYRGAVRGIRSGHRPRDPGPGVAAGAVPGRAGPDRRRGHPPGPAAPAGGTADRDLAGSVPAGSHRPDRPGDRPPGEGNAARQQATDLAAAGGAGGRIGHTYDFGDDWEHVIVVEEVAPAQPGVAYPRCLAGRRAAPPEDCGGLPGYDQLLEVLSDPHHSDHKLQARSSVTT